MDGFIFPDETKNSMHNDICWLRRINWQFLFLQKKTCILIANQNKPIRYVPPEVNCSARNTQYLQLHSEVESRIYYSHIKVGKIKCMQTLTLGVTNMGSNEVSCISSKNLEI